MTSYQGQEILTRWSQGGGSVLVSSIWHVSGGQTVTQTTADGASLSSQSYLSSDTDGQSPEGVLGVTAPLVQLLESHYVVAYAGTGSADNRTAQVVEAWRADGSIAARFWLDDATKLPLEREVFDTAAHVIGQDVFIDVSFATPGGPPRQAAAASASARVSAAPQGPWTDPLSRRQLLALRSRGWLVPAELPGGLSLFTGAETQADTGAVLDLGYSDGLSMVSVFEQRGKLPASAAGLAEDQGRRPRRLYPAGSALADLVRPRHGVHDDGGRAVPVRRRGGRSAAARRAHRVLEADVTWPGPGGVLGQPVPLTRMAPAPFRVDMRVFTCRTES